MERKWVYDSVPKLLEEHAPDLYKNFLLISKSEHEILLDAHSSSDSPTVQDGIEYLETDIYKASRELCKMQKMNNNVLSYWNESLITHVGVSENNPVQIQSQKACNNEHMRISDSKPNLSAWSKG